MSRTMRFGLALAAALGVLVLALPGVRADGTPAGTVNDAGYTWNNGYWWKDGKAYKVDKSWVAGTTYWANGCYHATPGYWATKYVEYPVAEYKKEEKKVTHTDPEWRTKLLEIANNRDKAEAAARKNAWEQKYFLEAVGALGLQGNFRWDGYGAAPPYGPPAALSGGAYGSTTTSYLPLNGVFTHQLQYGTYGANGATVYGQSLNKLTDLYGDNSLPQLYQQANRLAENAQRLSGQATQDFGLLVKEEGTNRARVAEILARAEAVKQFMQSIDGPPRQATETKTFEFKSEANGTATFGPVKPQAPAGDANYLKAASPSKAAFEAMFATRCAACHTGNTAKGKFTLDSYYAMTPDEKLGVWKLLVTNDKDKMMPRAKDGGPGEYIPKEEVRLFTEN